MMLGLFGVITIRGFLVGIPESIGLFAFGLALTVAAVLIRWILGRGETSPTDNKLDQE